MDMYTRLYLRWITNKDLLYSTWNSAQCHVAAWMGGSLGENGYMYMYGWVPSLFTWNITTLLMGYTPIQNKRFKNSLSFLPYSTGAQVSCLRGTPSHVFLLKKNGSSLYTVLCSAYFEGNIVWRLFQIHHAQRVLDLNVFAWIGHSLF